MRLIDSLGPVAQKVLLLLLGGLALGLSRSPRQSFKIIKAIRYDWRQIEKRALHRTIKKLYDAKLVSSRENNNTTEIFLTERGKAKARFYQLNEIKIQKMKRWDGKWRMITFDVPETKRKARRALNRVLKNMGCYQFQKSVFIHPFECKNEIDFVINFFNLRPYVRFAVAEHIDNERDLKKYFRLS